MKCRSPFVWFFQCLRNIWRMIFGRKRSYSGSGQGISSISSSKSFTGVTVNTITPAGSGNLQLANEDVFWGPEGQQRAAGKNPVPSLHQYSAAGPKTMSAADAWRQAQLQQKASPPPDAEEPNFFDSMAPQVQKPKIIRLRTETEEAAQAQSSRLAFNAAIPTRVNQFDWMEDQAPSGGNWETAIDDIDPKEIRKAQRKAQSSSTSISPANSSRP